MTLAIRAEFLKLRRPRLLWGVFAVFVGQAVLATALAFLTAKARAGALNADRPGAVVIGLRQLALSNGATRGFAVGASFSGIVILVLFAVSMASEYSSSTLHNLAVIQPRRVRLLAGKVIALLLIVAVGLFVAEVAAIASAYVFASIRHVPTSAWSSAAGLRQTVSAFGNATLASVGWGLLGIAVAVVFRSIAVALAVSLAWVMPFENILFNAWKGADKWFPGRLLQGVGVGTGGGVSWLRAATTLACYFAAVGAITTYSFARRDITV